MASLCELWPGTTWWNRELVGATEIDQVEQAKVNLEKLVIWKPPTDFFWCYYVTAFFSADCSWMFSCFTFRSISHWSWRCFENLWDLSELHIPNHFWKYISKNYLRNHIDTKKRPIYIWKDTISIFCRIIPPISRVQLTRSRSQGLNNDDFEESAGGGELEIPDSRYIVLTPTALSMFWVHLLDLVEDGWFFSSSFGKATCSEFQFHLVSVYASLFNWARGKFVVGRPLNRRRGVEITALIF